MIDKPEECCPVGCYHCTILMPIKGRVRGIDLCIADIVAALNAANIETVASCCGHGVMPGSIILESDREIIIVKSAEERNKIFDMLKSPIGQKNE